MRLLLLLLCPALASAGETAAFLKLGVGARAAGLGGAFTAVGTDATALAWNPAGLARLSGRELSVSHTELFAGARQEFLAYAHPTSQGTFAGGLSYLSQAALEGRDAQGRPSGSFTASDSLASFGYARKLEAGELGAAVKIVQSRIANASAQTFAVDLGARRELSGAGPGALQLGIAARNLGPGLRLGDETSELPLTVAAGLGYRLPAGVLLAAEYRRRPHGGGNEVAVGTEYAFISSFAMRAGFDGGAARQPGTRGITAASGFAAGFGLKLRGYGLDYSMAPFGELGNVQRFSLTTRF